MAFRWNRDRSRALAQRVAFFVNSGLDRAPDELARKDAVGRGVPGVWGSGGDER